MAGEQFVINVIMTGVPQTEAGAAKVTAATREMGAAAKGASASGAAAATTLANKWTGAGSKMTAVGKKLNRSVTLPIVAITAVTGKLAVDFEKSMRNVNSIAQLPEPAFKRLEKQVLAMAGPTAQAPKTLAEGLYDLVSSGFDASESITILNASARAATAGLTTTEVSTKAVAAALNAYHRPAKAAKQISDDLFQTVNLGVLTFDELASTIGYVLPAASSLGVDIKQVGASISTLTKEGQSASNSVTNINAAMTAFIKPTTEMSSVLKKLGYENSVQLIHQKGFQGALEAVTGAVHGNKEAIAGLFSNVRAMRAVFGLTGASAKGAAADLRGFQTDTGATAKVLSQQSKSIAFQWQKLKAEGSVLGIELGNKLIPVLRSLGKDVMGVLHAFGSLPDGMQSTIIKVLAFGAVMGPVLRIGGTFATMIGKIAKGMKLLAATDVAAGLAQAFSGDASILRILGGDLAGKLASGLKVGIPIAFAAYGVGNVISSLLSGNMKDAGFEAGGALVGGIAGFLAGGPLGAAIGVGLGSLGGELLSGLFNAAPKLKPLEAIQLKVAESSKQVTAAFRAEHQAVQALTRGGDRLHAARQREKQTSQAVKAAEQALAAVRRHSGPNSVPAIRAEVRLAEAKHKDAEASKEAQRAERLHGIELRATKDVLRATTLETRHHLTVLKDERQALVNHLRAAQASNADWKIKRNLLRGLNKNQEDTTTTQKKLSEAFLEAARVAGPKFAQSLQRASRNSLDLGKSFKISLADIRNPLRGTIFAVQGFGNATVKQTGRAQGAYEHLRGVLGPFRTTTQTQMQKATGDVQGFATGTQAAFKQVELQSNTTLTALGAKTINFGLQGGSGGRRGKGKARGGTMTVPGVGTQDTVPLVGPGINAVVAPGEKLIVANRHQSPELDLAVHNTYGDKNLEEFFRRSSRPHHMARGGILEPHLTGTDPMRGAGQHAIHLVSEAAKRYIAKVGGDKTYKSLVDNGNRMDALHQPYLWGGGHGATASRMGPWDCSGGISEWLNGAGWKSLAPMVSGGFESWGEPGQGRLSILANNEHVYGVLEGKGAIGTSGENPGGGFGWIGGYTFRPGFTIRTASLAGEGLPSSPRRGRGQKPAKGFAGGGLVVKGKVSWFTGGATAGGKTASSDAGLALNIHPGSEGGWNNATTQGWMAKSKAGHPVLGDTTIAGHHAVLPIIDLGPAGFTGRAIDVTAPGVAKLGLSTASFPTDSIGTVAVGATSAGGAGGAPAKPAIPKTAGFKVRGGATGIGGGTYAPGAGKVSTAKLPSFGSLPNDLHGVRKELGERRSELAQYQLAYHHAKDPEVKAALKTNIALLLNRIAALLKAQGKLAQKRHEKRVAVGIAKRGTFPDVEATLAADEGSYNKITEFASQVVDLEPSILTPAYAGQEERAYGSELGIERDWRNHLIAGIGTADVRTARLNAEINRIERLKRTNPAAYRRQRFRIKSIREAIGAVANTRSEWASKLGEVQGLNGPAGIVPTLPAQPEAGAYGGYIFQTQKAILDLGMRLKEAGGGGGGEEGSSLSERLELLEQENLRLKRERLVEQAQAPVLANYLGPYKAGGRLPADGYYLGHKDETVLPANAGPISETHVHLKDRSGVLEKLLDIAVETRLTETGRRVGLARATPSVPGRRAAFTQRQRRSRR